MVTRVLQPTVSRYCGFSAQNGLPTMLPPFMRSCHSPSYAMPGSTTFSTNGVQM